MSITCNNLIASADDIISWLKIISLNAHGYCQCVPALTAFCNKDEFNIDIICLQELWLSPDMFYNIETFSEDDTCYGVSSMDISVRSAALKGRPFCGVVCSSKNL
jgi:hypothetical protein